MLAETGIAESMLECIGIAVPGSITPDGQLVLDAYNLGFHNEPLKERIQAHFPGIPVALGNDADAAVLAELHKGALQGCKTAALYTLGTGIGGGFILNGKMFRGGRGNGIEPGHGVLVDGGEACTCGVKGLSLIHIYRADHYYHLLDFLPYVEAKLRANRDYQDRMAFGRKCLINTASAGKFSSDRTIREYASELWHILPVSRLR